MYIPDEQSYPDMYCYRCGESFNHSEGDILYEIDDSPFCPECAKKVYIEENYDVKTKNAICDGCGKHKKVYVLGKDGCFCEDCLWENDKYDVDEINYDLYAEEIEYNAKLEYEENILNAMRGTTDNG